MLDDVVNVEGVNKPVFLAMTLAMKATPSVKSLSLSVVSGDLPGILRHHIWPHRSRSGRHVSPPFVTAYAGQGDVDEFLDLDEVDALN